MNHSPSSSNPVQPNRAFTKAAQGCSRTNSKEIGELYSFRITPSEKLRLKEKAGRLTVSAYIRQRTLGEDVAPRRKLRTPSIDQKAIARLLGALGNSRLSSNMNQIAKAANMGALPVSEDLVAELHATCADIRAMRSELIAALGITAKD